MENAAFDKDSLLNEATNIFLNVPQVIDDDDHTEGEEVIFCDTRTLLDLPNTIKLLIDQTNLRNDKWSQWARLHIASLASSYTAWLGFSRTAINKPVSYDGTLGIS